MFKAMVNRGMWVGLACLCLTVSAWAGNTTAYYLTDGDAGRTVEILNGSVVNAFSTPQLGYPLAITNTIWIGNRDNQGGSEYTLGGAATGHTSTGGAPISQLLDGATDGTHNYGVTCCNNANMVTIANADWSQQQSLFSIPLDASGIAYDTQSGQLWVTFYDGSVRAYDMQGNQQQVFYEAGSIAGLAYDQSSNSLWAWNRNLSMLEQISISTGLLEQLFYVDVAQYGIGNPFGGEMAIQTQVPEPSLLVLFGTGLLLLVALSRRT